MYSKIVNQTYEEKIATLMTCEKLELVKMLIECNKTLDYYKPKGAHVVLTEDILFDFTLKLNIDSFGKYKKGDVETFQIRLIDEQNGLARFPISKHWDIIDFEIKKILDNGE